MTESVQPAPQDQQNETTQPVSEAVREAVESGVDVRERVREIVVNLFRGTQTTTASARAAVQGIVQTASEIVNRSAPANADSVLRNVIDGVASGLQSVAQSTQYAIQEAAARGQRFATEDIERAKKDLNGISDILIDTVRYFGNRMSTETGTTLRELKTHAERAATAAAPVVKASIEAVAKHPVQTAGEAASTAIRGTQLTAGALLSAMSGLLAGAAELLDPDRKAAERNPSTPTGQKDQNS
jgi:hypothetical protein